MEQKVRPTREEMANRTLQRLKRFTDRLESGEPISEVYSCRKIILDITRDEYTPDKVREARRLLNVSQRLFAQFLNVSPSLVQKWEQGVHTPEGAAVTLLDDIRRDPKYWRKRLVGMARVVQSSKSLEHDGQAAAAVS